MQDLVCEHLQPQLGSKLPGHMGLVLLAGVQVGGWEPRSVLSSDIYHAEARLGMDMKAPKRRGRTATEEDWTKLRAWRQLHCCARPLFSLPNLGMPPGLLSGLSV